MSRFVIQALILWSWQPLLLAQGVGSLRVAVIDNSASMSGKRCDTVRTELARLADRLPPSAEHPFALILFGTKAETAQVFIDDGAFRRTLDRIVGDGGGTSIGSGLNEAHRYLASVEERGRLELFLFSDGEDADRRGILLAEERLAQLLETRSRTTGLRNSVFVKRWGGANEDLVRRLAQREGIELIDVPESKFIVSTVNVTPRLELQRATAIGNGGELELTLLPSVIAADAAPGTALPRLRLECRTSGVELAPLFVESSAPPAPRVVRLTLAEGQAVAGRLELEFLASFEATPGAIGDVRLTQSKLIVPVVWTPPEIRNRIVATLEFDQAPRWSDPHALRAVYPLRIVFDVTAGDANDRADRSASLAIEPCGSTRIAFGQDTFTLPGPGRFFVALELELTLSEENRKLAEPRFEFGLNIKPIRLPPNVTFDPPFLTIEHDELMPPDPLAIEVEAAVTGTTPPVWHTFPNLAAFDAQVRVTSSARPPVGTSLRWTHGDEIKRLAVAPTTLAAAEQDVLMRIVAPLLPSPATSRLSGNWNVEPPHDRYSAFVFTVRQPFELTIVGPAPLELRHAGSTAPGEAGRLMFWDNAPSARLQLTPILAGRCLPEFGRALTVTIDAPGVAPRRARLAQSLTLDVPFRARPTPSFFRDTRETIDISIVPESASPAIRSGKVRWTIVRLAPFRRLSAWLIGGATSCLALFILVRTYNRLTSKRV